LAGKTPCSAEIIPCFVEQGISLKAIEFSRVSDFKISQSGRFRQNSLFFSLLAGSPTSIIKHLADYWRQVATGFGDTRAGSLRMLVRMLFWENMEDSPVIFSGDV